MLSTHFSIFWTMLGIMKNPHIIFNAWAMPNKLKCSLRNERSRWIPSRRYQTSAVPCVGFPLYGGVCKHVHQHIAYRAVNPAVKHRIDSSLTRATWLTASRTRWYKFITRSTTYNIFLNPLELKGLKEYTTQEYCRRNKRIIKKILKHFKVSIRTSHYSYIMR